MFFLLLTRLVFLYFHPEFQRVLHFNHSSKITGVTISSLYFRNTMLPERKKLYLIVGTMPNKYSTHILNVLLQELQRSDYYVVKFDNMFKKKHTII